MLRQGLSRRRCSTSPGERKRRTTLVEEGVDVVVVAESEDFDQEPSSSPLAFTRLEAEFDERLGQVKDQGSLSKYHAFLAERYDSV